MLANDSDADDGIDATSVAVAVGPNNGTVLIDAVTGVVTYTPNAGFEGDDTFTYTVTDLAGNESNVAAVTITVAPLRVEEFIINEGEAQRSNIETLTVRFSRDANIEALIASGAIADAITLENATQNVAVALEDARYTYDANTFSLRIDVTTDGNGGSRATLLSDADYTLSLDTALVTSAEGDTGLVDAWPGDVDPNDGSLNLSFHRLEADFDGDRAVTSIDLFQLRQRLFTAAPDPLYEYAFDLNADGFIDNDDYFIWRARLGLVL